MTLEGTPPEIHGSETYRVYGLRSGPEHPVLSHTGTAKRRLIIYATSGANDCHATNVTSIPLPHKLLGGNGANAQCCTACPRGICMTRSKFTFADAIARLEAGVDKSRKGHLFEHVIKRYFMHDPVYRQRFTDVWLWGEEDNPKRDGQDYGIDLVAREQDGTFTAIQCKFYNKDQPLAWPGLTKFLAATSRKNSPYAQCILVYTGKQLSKKQMVEINKHDCQLVDYKRLYDSNVPWDALSDLHKSIRPAKQHEEGDHQRDARRAVVSAFKDRHVKRGKLVMACGTGKTFTTLLISEEILGGGGQFCTWFPQSVCYNKP